MPALDRSRLCANGWWLHVRMGAVVRNARCPDSCAHSTTLRYTTVYLSGRKRSPGRPLAPQVAQIGSPDLHDITAVFRQLTYTRGNVDVSPGNHVILDGAYLTLSWRELLHYSS
jgi:hypothetical protein